MPLLKKPIALVFSALALIAFSAAATAPQAASAQTLAPAEATAVPCTAFVFEDFDAFAARHPQPEASRAAFAAYKQTISLPPVASVDLLGPFTKFVASPNGSLGFKNEVNAFSGVLIFEKTQDYAFEEGQTLRDFLQAILLPSTAQAACAPNALDPFHLSEQTYRVQRALPGGQLLAFGTDKEHRFYIFNDRDPNLVVSGLIKTEQMGDVVGVLGSVVVN